MAKDERALFEEFIDYCLRQRKLADLERSLAGGPPADELDKWNLTADEWTLALERAIAEYKEMGPRSVPR